MDEQKVAIKMSTIRNMLILAVIVIAGVYLLISPSINFGPYPIALILSTLFILWGAFYFYKSHKELDEMCCMMNNMAFSMIASFVIGSIVALPTGDFMLGIIVGTIVGLVLGVLLGELGGHLTRMEGIMAAPMGGTMGAMLGVMIRFYNVQMFMQYLLIILLIIVAEMTRINYSNFNKKMSSAVKYTGIILGIAILISALTLNFSIISNESRQELGGDFTGVMNNGIQEINIDVGAYGYTPDYVVLKKDVPVKITMKADSEAGCTRSVVFPDFGITKIIPKNGQAIIEFKPTREGTFTFRCSMNMARGTMIVKP